MWCVVAADDALSTRPVTGRHVAQSYTPRDTTKPRLAIRGPRPGFRTMYADLYSQFRTFSIRSARIVVVTV